MKLVLYLQFAMQGAISLFGLINAALLNPGFLSPIVNSNGEINWHGTCNLLYVGK